MGKVYAGREAILAISSDLHGHDFKISSTKAGTVSVANPVLVSSKSLDFKVLSALSSRVRAPQYFAISTKPAAG